VRLRTTIGLAALAAMLLQTTVAAAQSRGYDALVKEGIAEFELGHWTESRSLFEEAHALRPSARTRRGLGMVEFELRHYVASVRLLTAALADREDKLAPAMAASTEALVIRARTFVARYDMKLAPDGAKVTVGGMAAELEPDGSLLLDAGEHTLVVSAEGHQDHELKLDARGGDDKPIEVRLNAVEPEVTAPTPVSITPEAAARSTEPAPVAPADDAATAQDEEGGMLSQWWFWGAAGLVITAVVVGAVVASGGEDEIGSASSTTTGVEVMALEGL